MSEGAPKSNEVIMAEIAERKSAFYRDLDRYEVLVEFANKLKEKYPDHLDYELFHFLVGSTIRPETPPKYFDFPGEDSIEKFLRGQE
ncbi:MAG: hypothetical protein AB198_02395 [Parcubacteria bacterium C7867-003]|nr:MAG: hypothetical protein AB198_02395 [Parcubacteria bacterium C7867-003]